MTDATSEAGELVFTRVFDAPRELVRKYEKQYTLCRLCGMKTHFSSV